MGFEPRASEKVKSSPSSLQGSLRRFLDNRSLSANPVLTKKLGLTKTKLWYLIGYQPNLKDKELFFLGREVLKFDAKSITSN